MMLTTKDWIARAVGDAVAPGLAQAEAVGRSPDDWLEVAEAWLSHGSTEHARRCIEVALDRADGDHWPSRWAARLLLGPLADRDAATAALGRIAARLGAEDQRVRASDWTRLAGAYRDVLSDEDAAMRYLEQAAAMAVSASDLAELAQGYVEVLGDKASARDALERAELAARTRDGLRELWGIANAWRTLGDDARARSTLAIATAETTEIRDLTAFATAWRSLFDDDEPLGAVVQPHRG